MSLACRQAPAATEMAHSSGSTATTSQDKVFSNANLNVSVNAGDYFEIQTTTPATAPGISNIYGTLIIQ